MYGEAYSIHRGRGPLYGGMMDRGSMKMKNTSSVCHVNKFRR